MHRWICTGIGGYITWAHAKVDIDRDIGRVATYLGAVHAQVDMYGDRGIHYLGSCKGGY
jgi:hypothetical protein